MFKVKKCIASVGDEDTVLEVPYEDKTILIMMDGFKTDDSRIKTIYYSDDLFEDKGFLEQLSLVLNNVIESNGLDSQVLMQSDPDYLEVTESILTTDKICREYRASRSREAANFFMRLCA